MVNDICPKCKHKSLYFRSAFQTWRCSHCYKEFTKDKNQMRGNIVDENGNEYKLNVERINDIIIQTKTFYLQKGKSTLKGKHPKLKDTGCAFQDRLSCNYGLGFERCPFMKYLNNTWICDYETKINICT